MTERGSKYLKLKIDTDTGMIVKAVDEHGNKATPVSPEEMEEIYQSKNGFKFVTTILHAHSSPGCVYYYYGGWVFRICR